MVRGTAGIGLFAFGDLLAQKLEHHRKVDRGKALEPVWTWDSDRAFRTSSWRAVMWAPAATVFWNALDRNVKIGGFRGSLIKIAIDFCTIGPVITYSYLSWCKTWELGPEHATVSSVVAHANDRFFTVISRSSRACNHDGGCAAARHVANGGGGSQGGGHITVEGDR
eukprot:gene14767-24479_t